MSLRHQEKVARITDFRAVDTGRFVTIEVDYTTAGGVTKTLVMPHCLADQMRVAIVSEFESMPEEKRTRSFWASLKRKR
jgi:hypothetical protein